MTKKEALKVAGGSVNELARMLGITHNAVSQWDDKKIPELRKYQIKDLIDEINAQGQEAEPA
ncbi:Cro/CI family transcriptional regulator [Psychrobacter sp. ER1]|uniref:Cro/CI family transcriptional regulator n=1 Tax=Psychrobacter sp. ER1 TaxID=3406645 RepID=UPI003B428DC3